MSGPTIVPPEKRQICLAADRWRMSFNLDEVLSVGNPLPNTKKILSYILKNRYTVVEGDLDLIDEWIRYYAAVLKNSWSAASKAYQNGYRLPDDGHFINGRTIPYTKKEVKSIKAENKRLYSDVVYAKNQYERYKKRIDLWNEYKEKYLE